ncbi:MAG: hypothetical protein AAFX89_04470 [Pseudomonadota bacterium]
MKLLQIAFIAVLGGLCFATYATSKTLQQPLMKQLRGSWVSGLMLWRCQNL